MDELHSNILKKWRKICNNGQEKTLENAIWKFVQDQNTISSIDFYKRICYEIDCIITQNPKEVNSIIHNLNHKLFDWDRIEWVPFKELEINEVKYIEEPVKVEDGIHQCKNCGSKKTYSYQKQIRSGDEAMTLFIQCVNCQKQWKQ